MDVGIAQRGQQKSKTLWLLSKCIKFQNNNKFGTTQNTYLNILNKFPDNIYIFAIQNTCSLFDFTSVFKPRAIKGFFKTTQILKNPLHILLINVAFFTKQRNYLGFVAFYTLSEEIYAAHFLLKLFKIHKFKTMFIQYYEKTHIKISPLKLIL